MDSIQEIIHSMDGTQQKEFVYFIQRNKYRKGRKDLTLFNLLKEDRVRDNKELVKLLQTSNVNSYHTIRKRLFNHLADYFVLKSTSDDASPSSHVGGLIAVINYLFDKGLNKHAWKYLHLAESIAQQHHYHELLNTLLLMQIDRAYLNNDVDLNETIQKYKANREVLEQDEKIQIAMSMVRQQLDLYKQDGTSVKFHELIEGVLEELEIEGSILNNPRIMLRMQKIVRSGTMARKDFYKYEPYLVNTYERLYLGREKYDPMIRSEFLYLIAHTFYRNKKFYESLKYLSQMQVEIQRCGKSFQKKYNARMIQLSSANLVFLKDITHAIQNLEALQKKGKQLTTKEMINTYVNLGIYHFLNRDYKSSMKMLSRLTHSDNWYQKLFGLEWVFKKNLMEVILFIEQELYDLADSRLRSIERSYQSLKANEVYVRAFEFVWLLRQFLNNHTLNISGFEEKIEQRISFVPKEQEDLQAMAFYAWMKSKISGKTFYETLFNVVV